MAPLAPFASDSNSGPRPKSLRAGESGADLVTAGALASAAAVAATMGPAHNAARGRMFPRLWAQQLSKAAAAATAAASYVCWVTSATWPAKSAASTTIFTEDDEAELFVVYVH